MEITTLLKRFETSGNDWPNAVLDRLFYLSCLSTIHGGITEKEEAEYIMLLDWVRKTLSAGIAFHQQSLIEH